RAVLSMLRRNSGSSSGGGVGCCRVDDPVAVRQIRPAVPGARTPPAPDLAAASGIGLPAAREMIGPTTGSSRMMMTQTTRGNARTSSSSDDRQLMRATMVRTSPSPNRSMNRRTMPCIMPRRKSFAEPPRLRRVLVDLDPLRLLTVYDDQLRTWLPDPAPAGMVV